MNNSKNISIVLIILILVLGVGIYFFTFYKPSQKLSLPSLSKNGSAGLNKAENLVKNYPSLVKNTTIQMQVEGYLKAKTNNSWTIEKNGESLTLTQYDTTRKILFLQSPNTPSPSGRKEISPDEIRIGDLITIVQGINYSTGDTSINFIEVKK